MNVRAPALMRATGERLLDLGVVAVLVGGLLLPLVGARAQTGDPVLLNEVLLSHTGDDTTEFLELYGTPGHSLAGLSLVVVDGDSSAAGTIDVRVDFAADATLGGNGFYLAGNPVGLAANYGVTPDIAVNATLANGFLENGSQTVALVATPGLGAVGTTVTGGEDVRDAVAFHDGGFAETFFWDAPVVDMDDGFLPAGAHRAADGLDTDSTSDWALADFNLGAGNTPTAATPFDEPPTAQCGPTLATSAGVAASAPVTATDPDGMIAGFDLALAPDPGAIALGGISPSAGTGLPASTSLEVGAATPAGHYDVVVTALTAATPSQSASCTVAVVVEPAPEPPPPDPPEGTLLSLEELRLQLDALVDAGSADPDRVAVLEGHLDRAARLLERDNVVAAAAQLQAFANHTRGYAPRWLDQAAADELSEGATALAAELAG